jgi:hypothetical protein
MVQFGLCARTGVLLNQADVYQTESGRVLFKTAFPRQDNMHHVALHSCPVSYPFFMHDLHTMNSSSQKMLFNLSSVSMLLRMLAFSKSPDVPSLCSLTLCGLLERLLICLRLMILALMCPSKIASFRCTLNAKPSLCNIHMRFLASALCSVQPMYRHSAQDPFVLQPDITSSSLLSPRSTWRDLNRCLSSFPYASIIPNRSFGLCRILLCLLLCLSLLISPSLFLLPHSLVVSSLLFCSSWHLHTQSSGD